VTEKYYDKRMLPKLGVGNGTGHELKYVIEMFLQI